MHARQAIGFIVAAVWTLQGSQVHAQANPAKVIPNFHAVAFGKLYRGSRPGRAGLEALRASGITAVINLQGGDRFAGFPLEDGESAEDIRQEQRDASDLGLRYFSVPLSAVNPDTRDLDRGVGEILALFDKLTWVPGGETVFIHCFRGKDRTGLVAALYRVLEQGCTPRQAHAEMMGLGHSPWMPWLDHYFWERLEDDSRVHERAPGPGCPLSGQDPGRCRSRTCPTSDTKGSFGAFQSPWGPRPAGRVAS